MKNMREAGITNYEYRMPNYDYKIPLTVSIYQTYEIANSVLEFY